MSEVQIGYLAMSVVIGIYSYYKSNKGELNWYDASGILVVGTAVDYFLQ